MGTAGSLSLIKNIKSENILLMNSDLFTDIDFEKMFLSFVNKNADFAVASKNYVHDVPYAIIDSKFKVINRIKEKPSYILKSNAGIYIFKSKLIKMIPKNKFYDITDFINYLLDNKYKLIHDEINGYWIDIGSPNEYKLAQELIKTLKMIENVLWLITARSGSKSIKDKNIKLLGDYPLFYYKYHSVKKITPNENIWASTDSKKYAEIFNKFGLNTPFIRPSKLSEDDSSSEDVIIHAMDYAESINKEKEYICLLEPTSPFIYENQLTEALKILQDNANSKSLVSTV